MWVCPKWWVPRTLQFSKEDTHRTDIEFWGILFSDNLHLGGLTNLKKIK